MRVRRRSMARTGIQRHVALRKKDEEEGEEDWDPDACYPF